MTHVCLDQPEGHLEQDGGGGVEEQLGDGDNLCQHDGGECEEDGDPGAHNDDGEQDVDLEDVEDVDDGVVHDDVGDGDPGVHNDDGERDVDLEDVEAQGAVELELEEDDRVVACLFCHLTKNPHERDQVATYIYFTSVLSPKVQLTMMYWAKLNVSMLRGLSAHLYFKHCCVSI